MSESDLVKLYSGAVLQLAGSIPHLGRLSAPAGTAHQRAPMCGSTITADLMTQDGRITDFAQEVRACALGQASAALLGRVVIGRDRAEIARARAQVAAMLQSDAPTPQPPFEGYEVLRVARDYKNRHASILLALDTALAAMDAAAS